MTPRHYVDFDLVIEPEEDGFTARVVDSPAGQATRRFDLPFTDVGLENFVLKLGHSRTATRRARVTRRDTARKFGTELYKAVFDDEVEVCFRVSLEEALRNQQGLRIRLRTEEATSLAEIPWEYMYSEGLGRFVAMSTDTPLVRYLELPAGSAPLAVDPPLRVLVMVASPDDLDPLDVDREVALLRQATADLAATGAVELEVAPTADLRTLQRLLRTSQYHVFHFIGHGVFDRGDGLLMLQDETGRSQPVSGLDLGVLLHDHHSLRLAVLNACEGARGTVEDPVGGVAQTLIRQGLPAAVAMQFEITDEAALVFAHEFYLAIADGYPIDAATAEARKAIFASGNDVEWGTPVLHLRASDGRVFDVQRRATVRPQVDEAREGATGLLTERRFDEAAAAWEQIAEAAPEDETAHLMLERARNGAWAASLYGDVAGMIADGRPQDAVAMLGRVAELDPDHGDPDHLEEQARTAIAHEAERQEQARQQAERREREQREAEERARQPAPTPTPAPPAPAPPTEEPDGRSRASSLRWLALVAVGVVVALVAVATLGDGDGDGDGVGVEVVDVNDGDGGGGDGALVAVPVSGISIDGSFDDWPIADPVAVSDRTVFPEPGAGSDIGAEWLLGWDQDALYLAADVTDPSIDPGTHDRPDQLFRGDSVHFEFGPDPTGAGSVRDGVDRHVMLAPFQPEDPVVLPAVNPVRGGAFVSGGVEPAIEAATVFTGNGYVIEARVPWGVLGLDGPPAGAFGLNLNVSDADGGSSLETMVSTNPDRTGENQARPDTWQRGRLDGR